MDSLEQDISILCITEHWLQEGNINMILINDFELATYCARKEKYGGGSAIYVRRGSGIMYKERLDIRGQESVFETCGIEVTSPVNFNVLTCYRAPNAGKINDFMFQLETVLSKTTEMGQKTIFCGDININIKEDALRAKLEEVSMAIGFDIIDCGSTRITSMSESSIDLAISNWDSIFFQGNIDSGLSDHYAQIFSFGKQKSVAIVETNRKEPTFKRRFSSTAIQNFIWDLASVDWSAVYLSCTVDAKYNSFLLKFMLLLDKHFPKKQSRNKVASNKGWITQAIKDTCSWKRTLSRLSKSSHTPEIKVLLTRISKNLKMDIRRAKKQFHSQQIQRANNKSGATWRLVNHLTGKQNTGVSAISLMDSENLVTDQNEVATKFNNFFVTVGCKAIQTQSDVGASMTKLRSMVPNKLETLDLLEITNTDIINVVKAFKPKRSSGWDEIPMFLIKKCIWWIVAPLSHIFSFSCYTGVFPEKLKWAIIKPLYKKGDKKCVSNYRPISLLPSFSKILEKIVLNRIIDHATTHAILGVNQHGFRAGFSTMTAIHQVTEKITKALENKQKIALIMCDLSKAFDTVDHEILLSKLDHYGISGVAGSWMRSFLTGRKQRVHLNEQGVSPWETIDRGVPQGSILSPMCFSLLVNDLASCMLDNKPARSIVQFADDSSGTITANSFEELENELAITTVDFGLWFTPNNLKLNEDKTQVLLFAPQGKEASLPSDRSVVLSASMLGLTLDQHLNWVPHINGLLAKLARATFAMRVLARQCEITTLRIVYFAQVQSIISYGVIFWGSVSSSSRIFRAQKKILRTMIAIGPRMSCRQVFRDLNILTLPCLYILEVCKFVKGNLGNFKEANQIHGYSTRTAGLLAVERHRLKTTSLGPYQMGRKLFNKLPSKIKDIDEGKKFNEAVKVFLLSKGYYSIDEFLLDK